MARDPRGVRRGSRENITDNRFYLHRDHRLFLLADSGAQLVGFDHWPHGGFYVNRLSDFLAIALRLFGENRPCGRP